MPQTENTLSDGADVAGIEKIIFANWDNIGNDFSFLHHHSKTSLTSSFIEKSRFNSLSIVDDFECWPENFRINSNLAILDVDGPDISLLKKSAVS